MTDYCDISDLEEVLRTDITTELDALADRCITSASAMIDALLKVNNLTVPATVPQLIMEATAWLAAWMFRRTSDPVGAEVFWNESQRFLNLYAQNQDEGEIAFKVGSD